MLYSTSIVWSCSLCIIVYVSYSTVHSHKDICDWICDHPLWCVKLRECTCSKALPIMKWKGPFFYVGCRSVKLKTGSCILPHNCELGQLLTTNCYTVGWLFRSDCFLSFLLFTSHFLTVLLPKYDSWMKQSTWQPIPSFCLLMKRSSSHNFHFWWKKKMKRNTMILPSLLANYGLRIIFNGALIALLLLPAPTSAW